jgi:hypothetical protein
VAEVEEVKGMTGVENMTGMAVMTGMANDIREDRRCLEGVNRLSIYIRPPYPPYDGGHE